MLSIKARQVAGVTSLVGAVVVAVSALHLASLARVSLQETASRGEMLARAIYQRARDVVPSAGDPYAALRHDSGLRSILESAAAYSKNVTYAAIVDTGGVAVAHSFPALEGRELPAQGDLNTLQQMGAFAQLGAIYSDSTFEIRQPLLFGERAFGAIRIGVSPLLVRSELQQGLRRAAGTALMALLVATAVAMLLAQWILRPIHVIKSGLTRLGRGEFDVRLDLPPGEEFRELGSSFEELATRLSAGGPNPAYSRKLVALGRLLAGVAHEVKNPLNAMMIHLELLKNKLRRAARPAPVAAGVVPGLTDLSKDEAALDTDTVMQHVEIIAVEIRRLDEVLQGFLKFARPEEMKLQPLDAGALLDDVARVVRPQADAARVELQTECASGLPPINADPTMLNQALMNLALNACQAMPNGGTLRMAARRAKDGRVEIDVVDTGVGIPPEHLGRIFDLYFTTKERGSGIGLSMVYRIVQLHDGDVEVESTPGRGTTFSLLLPTATESSAQSGQRTP